MSAVPSTPDLATEVARLADLMAPYIHRPMDRLERLLRLQHHATLQAIDPRPITETRSGNAAVKVFELDRYRHLSAECHDDDDGGRAA